ncbi:MAG: iron-containing alcohol dehydrogenase [Rhodospirillaceae bacterium]|nr:iron-containing alcohol dehydrogenase [Rhodospirillaceae bacterium]
MSDKPDIPHADWAFPTEIRFGPGRVRELPELCRELGVVKPLLVTDSGIAALPMTAAILNSCQADGLSIALFSDVQPNPVERNVIDGVSAYQAGGHDGVIALGGGSSLDVGKAVALMAVQKYPLRELTIASFQDFSEIQSKLVTHGLPPVITVPTTSGTGSELGRASAIIDEQSQTKKGLFHPVMMPQICLADPELTLSLPPAVTAAVGFDALSHSLEAYCCAFPHPFADGVALQGMALVNGALVAAYRDGSDLGARARMMMASLAGGTAFQKGVGAVHALSHPLSSRHGIHHGLANAVLMPYVLAFNMPVIEAKLAALARYLDLAAPSGQAIIDWLVDLRAECDIPHRLAGLGIAETDIDTLAPLAAADITAVENPVAVDEDDMAALYRAALAGDLSH